MMIQRLEGKVISQFDAISKLQSLNIDMVITTIEKVIERSKEEKNSISYSFS